MEPSAPTADMPVGIPQRTWQVHSDRVELDPKRSSDGACVYNIVVELENLRDDKAMDVTAMSAIIGLEGTERRFGIPRTATEVSREGSDDRSTVIGPGQRAVISIRTPPIDLQLTDQPQIEQFDPLVDLVDPQHTSFFDDEGRAKDVQFDEHNQPVDVATTDAVIETDPELDEARRELHRQSQEQTQESSV